MENIFLSVVTSQALLILYYASSSWLTQSLRRREMENLDGIRTLRYCDYWQRLSRDLISTRTNRLPPRQWCKFAGAFTLMNLWQNNCPVILKQEAFANTLRKTIFPGLLFGFDSSKLKIGRQQTKNLSGSVPSQVKVSWMNLLLSKDRMRVILKATFYPHIYITFNYWFNVLLHRLLVLLLKRFLLK